ncbi:stalk domain-containing protein [Peptoniphilus vaginalis]|uniref:stalk domain-containing protein n=1 Tax=Peptoniphilus vaginalis TaxID=1756987 RepID=UPI00142F52E1|nr:stalk domain-containing protein [Peptoniphilus vaginalis]
MEIKSKRIMGLILALVMLIGCLPLNTIATYAATGDVVIDATNFPDEKFRVYVIENFDKNNDYILSQEERDAVKSIDVSLPYNDYNSSKIISLEGIEHFKNITSLKCSYNHLISLDVSNNKELTELDCSTNPLKSLDVSNNKGLTKLDCSYNGLTSLDVSNNKELTELDCSGNYLTSIDVSNNKGLTKLDCSYNGLTSLDVSNNKELTELNCSNNGLTSIDVSNNNELTRLECNNNQLTSVRTINKDYKGKVLSPVTYGVKMASGSSKIPFGALPAGFNKANIQGDPTGASLESDGFNWDKTTNPISFKYKLCGNPEEIVDAELRVLLEVVGPVDPTKPEGKNPDESKYCTVKFESEDESKGTVAAENTFYVLKTAGKTLADLKNSAPATTALGNNKFDGWNPVLDVKTAIDQDRTVKAKFVALDEVLGPKDPTKADGKNPDTNKYWTVKFESEDKSKGTVAAENTFYVLKTANKSLADLKNSAPATTALGNNKFDGWNPTLDTNTAIDQDRTVKAKFSAKEIVKTGTDPNTQVLNGYTRITFDATKDGNINGQRYKVIDVLTGTAWDNQAVKNEIPARATYKDATKIFTEWDSTVPTAGPVEEQEFTATYREPAPTPNPTNPIVGPVDPSVNPNPDQEKNWTVKFAADPAKGTIAAENTFYVLKTEHKTLADLVAKAPKVTAREEFKFTGWDPALDANTAITGSLTVNATFEKVTVTPAPTPNPTNPILGPVDPSVNPNPDQEKNWTVKFAADPAKGTIAAENTFYVLKTEHKTLADLVAKAPKVTAREEFKFTGWDPALDANTAITGNLTVNATFEKVTVTPAPTPTPSPNPPIEYKRDHTPSIPVIVNVAKTMKLSVKLKVELVIGSKEMIESIDGLEKRITMDVAPFIEKGITMLPIRFVAEGLGFNVRWDKDSRTVILIDKENLVKIPVDTNKIIVNGKEYTSDVKPVIKNDRTMLPIANIARALGLKDGKDIHWNESTKEVIITREVVK